MVDIDANETVSASPGHFCSWRVGMAPHIKSSFISHPITKVGSVHSFGMWPKCSICFIFSLVFLLSNTLQYERPGHEDSNLEDNTFSITLMKESGRIQRERDNGCEDWVLFVLGSYVRIQAHQNQGQILPTRNRSYVTYYHQSWGVGKFKQIPLNIQKCTWHI